MSNFSQTLGFDGRVAVVTGAAGGLGAAYARMLAARGAAVVVNDVAGANELVAEIVGRGGRAVACVASVEEGERIVAAAMEAFGRLDIVINNAGILRDRTFKNISDEEWNAVYRVHVMGAYRVTKAAWPVMRDQKYGRVIMTSSGAGLFGNFGQSNYAMAKAALAGFARALALEGKPYGIHVNTVSPSAATQLGATMLDPENMAVMSPDLVSPLVAYLCHETTTVTGQLFEVGAGRVAQVRYQRAGGVNLGTQGHTPEDIANHWHQITDFSQWDAPTTLEEVFAPFEKNLPKKIMPSRD